MKNDEKRPKPFIRKNEPYTGKEPGGCLGKSNSQFSEQFGIGELLLSFDTLR